VCGTIRSGRTVKITPNALTGRSQRRSGTSTNWWMLRKMMFSRMNS
jgi:hypothetical protein